MPSVFRTLGVCLALAAPSAAAAEVTVVPPADTLAPHAAAIAENIDWITPDLAHSSLEKTLRLINFVMSHEIAHLLITELELPVLGWEEDAADTLAVAMLLGTETEDNYDTLLAATQGWAMAPPGNLPPEALYDEHSLDLQRAYHAVCLMVGRNPDRYAQIADIMQMPDRRRQRCIRQSKRALDGWRSVLDPHRRGAEDPAPTIQWSYFDPAPDLQGVLAAAFAETQALQVFAGLVTSEFSMPRTAHFEARPCGYPGAWYDPHPNRITICYEFIQDYFMRFALYDGAKAGLVPAAPEAGGEGAPPADDSAGFGTNSPLGDGEWSISISTDGGVRAVTSDGRVITTRPGAGGDTNIHTGAQRTCPGAGTWPTCY